PVSTTMQGLSVFPHDHPLHAGFGFGPSSIPSAERAFVGCDVLLTVGARFGELATGSFNLPVPAGLIHSDINPDVFNKNYPAQVTIAGDAKQVLTALLAELSRGGALKAAGGQELRSLIRSEKEKYFSEWTAGQNTARVSPGHFFKSLRARLPRDAYLVVDDGNHTFLAAEQFPVYESKHFISPTDFNAMGYAVPAAIGVALSHPKSMVAAIVGDGAFLMTGLEILTATTQGVSPVFFVFYDGELGQISQFQQIPLNRKTCTIVGDVKLEGLATATGAAYIEIKNDAGIDRGIDEALSLSKSGRPVIVDVKIDYSKKTRFTQGVVKANLSRFPMGEKFRFIGRAIKRHILG
ncbi:MAG: thiamine pyrophosphate-dependent enzyme, partial [Bdellovibrionota bacterium]